MPGFNDTFISNMRSTGFVKPNRFVAFITPSSYVLSEFLGFRGGGEILRQRLATTCFAAAVPNLTLNTHDFGVSLPERRVPYSMNTNNQSGVQLEFYCLGDMFEKEVFQAWSNGIIDPVTRQAAYYDDYAKDSKIDLIHIPSEVSTYDDVVDYLSAGTYTGVSGYTFTEVYPFEYMVNNGTLNYQPNAAPLSVRVSFGFRDMLRMDDGRRIEDTMRYTDEESPSNPNDRLSSTLFKGFAFLGQAKGFGILPNFG